MKERKLNKKSNTVFRIDDFLEFIIKNPEAYKFILSLQDNKRENN